MPLCLPEVLQLRNLLITDILERLGERVGKVDCMTSRKATSRPSGFENRQRKICVESASCREIKKKFKNLCHGCKMVKRANASGLRYSYIHRKSGVLIENIVKFID